MMEKYKCKYCKKEFKSYNPNQRTCSIKCRTKEGLWKKNLIGGISKRDFSGKKNPRWNGGNSRGYILKKAKEGILKKKIEPSKCEKCNKRLRLVIHHKDRNNKNNNPNNLELLCFSCHQLAHPEKERNKFRCKKCGRLKRKDGKHNCFVHRVGGGVK